MREPGNAKKIKAVNVTKRKAPRGVTFTILKGIVTDHYLHFVSDKLDTTNGFSNMKGFQIVMDNVLFLFS